MAYQGFGEGIAEDGAVIARFIDSGLDFFVATSFSKSFSLYGERVGALSVVCESKNEADRVLSQIKRVIRTNYSNPPTHGAQVVATVLTTPALRKLWEEELAGMRVRIKQMRLALLEKLHAAGVKQDMSFITQQKGMFSYYGLSKEQMQQLRSEFGIYGGASPARRASPAYARCSGACDRRGARGPTGAARRLLRSTTRSSQRSRR